MRKRKKEEKEKKRGRIKGLKTRGKPKFQIRPLVYTPPHHPMHTEVIEKVRLDFLKHRILLLLLLLLAIIFVTAALVRGLGLLK